MPHVIIVTIVLINFETRMLTMKNPVRFLVSTWRVGVCTDRTLYP
jgi:hypothetical protein